MKNPLWADAYARVICCFAWGGDDSVRICDIISLDIEKKSQYYSTITCALLQADVSKALESIPGLIFLDYGKNPAKG